MLKTIAVVLALAGALPQLAGCSASAQADDLVPTRNTLRDEFVCPGMHAEWLDAKTVQCLKERT